MVRAVELMGLFQVGWFAHILNLASLAAMKLPVDVVPRVAQ